jgi:SAM-dependent methyltransferase
MDPRVGGVRAARRVALQLGVHASFVVGDARFIPLRAESADVVFSYSVLQHLSPDAVRDVFRDVRRVLRPTGRFVAQFANAIGVRSLLVQARRRFRTPVGFEVRYWTVPTLARTVETLIGPTTTTVDGFFSVNVQPSDVPLLPARYRWLVRTSEALRRVSDRLPLVVHIADSVYVSATPRAG